MKIIFLGTPDFAVPSLKKLVDSHHEILAVVTQTDKKVGRDQKVVFSPVKKLALENSIKVLQYNKIRVEGVDDIKALSPDIMVTCAFGQILSQELIDIAPLGIINVHGSLLPKYRGAAPIQQAVIDGEEKTGITIMQTEAGIDTGDILSVVETPIGENETAGELFDRLAEMGANLLMETLDRLEKGEITPIKQDHSKATHVSMIKKGDGLINWENDARSIFNHIRGMNPWPCAFTMHSGKMLKIFAARVVADNVFEGLPGAVLSADIGTGLLVKCGKGALLITELQLEGGRRMTSHDFLLGRKISVGDRFTW